MSDANCVFCKIAAGEIPVKPLAQSDRALAFADLNPQAPTHVLVIPKKHLASLAHAQDADEALLGHLLAFARSTAAALGVAERGYRIVINSGHDGGQTVSHLHLHLLAGRQLSWPPG